VVDQQVASVLAADLAGMFLVLLWLCSQALAAEALLTGASAVIAAETGSGKTMAYAAPIASALLKHKEAQLGCDRCAASAVVCRVMKASPQSQSG
jgi:ATP-dependent helicase YprA (DUF1998 family)